MVRFNQTSSFGQLIRERREYEGLSIKRVALALDLDQAILHKIEIGQRNASEIHIKPLARILNIDELQLHIAFQAEQILRVMRFDKIGLLALQVVEAEVKTYVHKSDHRNYQLEKMRSVFRNFQRVTKAYIYDAIDTGDQISDDTSLCFAVELDQSQGSYSLNDLQRSLKITLNRTIDIEHMDMFKPVTQQNGLTALELVYQKK